ncbi:MAG: DNA-directed RNA polymerase subunit beta [Rickettsiaceae bacterium]
MVRPLFYKQRVRRSFQTIDQVISIPNLIDMQLESYMNQFLQYDVIDGERKDSGLQSIFNSILPVHNQSGMASLEFVRYTLSQPKYEVRECIKRGVSYVTSLKATLRLNVWDVDEDTSVKEIKGIKEQEVYLGDIPLMTNDATFIINGTERVIVSQMHRSPGVFFYHDNGKAHSSGKLLYSARVIPYRGSWLDFEFDAKDIVYFRIDRKRKLYATTLLYALGMSKYDIFSFYYDSIEYFIKDDKWIVSFDPEKITPNRLKYDLIDAETGEVLLSEKQKITTRIAKKLASQGLKNVVINPMQLIDQCLAQDVFDNEGVLLLQIGDVLNEERINLINTLGIESIKLLDVQSQQVAYMRNTIFLDKNSDQNSALVDIFRILRPGEPPTVEAAKFLLYNSFFDPARYDLSNVGRIKINAKLGLDLHEENQCTLTQEDIKYIVKEFLKLKDGNAQVDDIDHLGNRRIRSVGELVYNQFQLGLIRVFRTASEIMSATNIDSAMPNDLVNFKTLVSILKEFFGSSQLSQFMDQTNSLSEVTHKRRLSALGPGGLSRDRAGFEVRDVHSTHYGRICPIETPEGSNVGLINSMATYTRINKYGFIETPYRKVVDGIVTNEVVYLSVIEEEKYNVGQANVAMDRSGKLQDAMINCRIGNGNFALLPPSQVHFIDVTPMQVVSIAASLIPFLENNDANRALMGSNMQRQAVPLVRCKAPFVGTGVEKIVAKDSGAALVALNSGVVEYLDSRRIIIRISDENDSDVPNIDVYNLLKFQKSNHNTCINQRPMVKIGQYVDKGDIIADGSSTDNGEIALGANVLVSFLSWNGYNFEDSIVISERIVKDDVYTSIHIEEFEVVTRDTKLGPEEITRDIPNVSEEQLRHLDETGIVCIGSRVEQGDVLVAKVTPKSESPVTSEEKLLRAIFGEKASDVRDTSLRVPPDVSGVVIDVTVFSRRGIDKDERSISIEKQEIEKLMQNMKDEMAIIENFACIRIRQLLKEQKASKNLNNFVKSGESLTDETLKAIPNNKIWDIEVEDIETMDRIIQIKDHYTAKKKLMDDRFTKKVESIQAGDDLPPAVFQMVKVYVATKRKLEQGDKMAGRHGNKGVISRVVPEEDMPFLEDGTVVDVILNPLGVPSRMNVGQILETHLGYASFNLTRKVNNLLDEYNNHGENLQELREFVNKIYAGSKDGMSENITKLSDIAFLELCKNLKKGVYFSTPVFDGAKIDDIKSMLQLAGQDDSGQIRLIDGRTGEYFDRKVTIGYQYLLKLHHLVDDKIHARSIGPYSLVTQQPLGGKAYFGGQRFGEMETWALEAYGAAYTLQEMLTVKSDDVVGRTKLYEHIVRGDSELKYGVPESFNVMWKELLSLGLDLRFESDDDNNN